MSEAYKWSHPIEWLEEKIEAEELGDLDAQGIARAIAGLLDGDQIQDLFQKDMDDDGYFNKLTRAEELDRRETAEAEEMNELKQGGP